MPLREFLATAGTLIHERMLMVERTLVLMENSYVHLPLKSAMRAVNPSAAAARATGAAGAPDGRDDGLRAHVSRRAAGWPSAGRGAAHQPSAARAVRRPDRNQGDRPRAVHPVHGAGGADGLHLPSRVLHHPGGRRERHRVVSHRAGRPRHRRPLLRRPTSSPRGSRTRSDQSPAWTTTPALAGCTCKPTGCSSCCWRSRGRTRRAPTSTFRSRRTCGCHSAERGHWMRWPGRRAGDLGYHAGLPAPVDPPRRAQGQPGPGGTGRTAAGRLAPSPGRRDRLARWRRPHRRGRHARRGHRSITVEGVPGARVVWVEGFVAAALVDAPTLRI
jgi:hypothetical protein